MPRIYEIFGKPVKIDNPTDLEARKLAICPFTESLCDGGGNRHQTKITLAKKPSLREFFDSSLEKVIPGVCSIYYGSEESSNNDIEAWVVCPRRLLGFKNESNSIPEVNIALKKHEQAILLSAEIPRNIDIGIWSEVYLRYGDNETNSQVDYHFDFVAAPIIRNVDEIQFQELFDLTAVQLKETVAIARKSKICSGRIGQNLNLSIVPDLFHPYIFEVMTASTSGSNTEKGTDIASAFANGILGQDAKSPGINKRQVWGRMATQLFSKSALAEFWGGKTFWIVQDQLLKNIEKTTMLSVKQIEPIETGNINFISMTYFDSEEQEPEIILENSYRNRAGINFLGNNAAVDILLPKTFPDKTELLKAILRRKLSAVINL